MNADARSAELLARLEWQLRRRSESTLAGDYRSVFRGRGMEFEHVVKYQWGDDLRDIDWNVTARLGEPYRKQFAEERDRSVLLIFEDAPELQFGSAGRTRRETLLEAAVLLMLIALRQRDRVGVLYASPDQVWLRRPLAARAAVYHTIARLLEQPAPALDAAPAVESPWRFARRAAPRHSVVAWLGAFGAADEPEDWAAVVRRYQVVGLRADDPWDHALPQRGVTRVFDPLAGGAMEIDFRAPRNRAAHARWAEERNARFAALFPDERERHALRTDASVFDSLVEFFHRQAHRASVATS